MHWLIVGNGTAHRKPTAVMSLHIDASTLTLLGLVCATDSIVIARLWRKLWTQCPTFEALPPGSKELLPIAASHLQELGLTLAELPFPADLSSSVLLGKCKAIWARNVLVLRKAQTWSRLLRDAGVDAVAIKGVTSISRDRVLGKGRQTLDVDLLILLEQWDLAEQTLMRSGYFHSCDAPQQWSEGRGWVSIHAQHWRGDGVDLDLHRHPQPGFLTDLAPFAFLQNPVRDRYGILTPQAGDHVAILLLHAFTHANAASEACFRYFAEALRSTPTLRSSDHAALAHQLRQHDNGTRIQKQMDDLKKTITSLSAAQSYGDRW